MRLQQFFPGAGADTGQGQAVFTAKPGKARTELAGASRRRTPAAQGVMVGGLWHLQGGALLGAPDHAVEPRNGHPGEADGDLVARANIQ
ncbi:hypothetical protein FQZ97_681510 [compost metagenome]